MDLHQYGVCSSTTGYTCQRSSLLAIAEGRGQARGEVGIAALDLDITKLIICQFTDSQKYHKVISKLNIFRPSEILIPSTSCDISRTGQASQLYLQIQEGFPGVTVVPLQRRVFSEAVGLQRIKELAIPECESIVFSIAKKYYGLAAAAALLKYIELVRGIIFPTKALKVDFQLAEKTVIIDLATSQHLELVQNNIVTSSPQSLLGVINQCCTPGGRRCLRMNLLQPFCDLDLINRRLDCIQEFRNSPLVLYDLMNVLSQLPQDLEHVISTLVHIPKVDSVKVTEQRINYIIFLKQTLQILPNFVQVLGNCHHHYFQFIKEHFLNPVFEAILQKILIVINEDSRMTKSATSMRIQRSRAVNSDLNPLLRMARQALSEIQSDTVNYVTNLSNEYQLNFRLMENTSRGYYIQHLIPGRTESHVSTFPDKFLNLTRRKNVVTFTTEELLLADQRMGKILQEIHNITSVIVSELLTNIRGDIGCLYQVCDDITELDIIFSLTTYSTSALNMTRPEFTTSCMALSMVSHPILSKIMSMPTVSNDFYMSTDTNVAIITGPNMSGKTTFLKQVATLQVLAQIGSFVPAQAASFRVMTRIFSRIGNGDKIEENASSFALEMREMSYILSNVNDQSLIIIDELGRSTAIDEGAAISWAMIENLMNHKAFLLFATHFFFVTKMESMYFNILNYHLITEESTKKKNRLCQPDGTISSDCDFVQEISDTQLNYQYVLQRGVTDVENYGLKLAKNASFPPEVIRRALELAKEMKDSKIPLAKNDQSKLGAETYLIHPRQRALYLLGSHLFQLSSSGALEVLSQVELANYLQNLKEEFQMINRS